MLKLIGSCNNVYDFEMRVFLLHVTFIQLLYAEIHVLILARGGSKGVFLKNIQTVGGVSLVGRAILTARLAGLNVTVSTDHPLIALDAIRHGASKFHRSKVTATDSAPSIWGAAEFLASKPKIRTLILLQATSPFIRPKQLRDALDKLESFDCVFSVTRSFKLRWIQNSKVVTPLNFKLHSRPRRQDWSGELLETGAFYLTRRHLIEQGIFQNHNCTVIEVSAIESLEVDSRQDLALANALLRANLA